MRRPSHKTPPRWREMHLGDDPGIESLQLRRLRETPVYEKARQFRRLYRAARRLALPGLANRYPDARTAELRRRLADLLLGPELAARVSFPRSLEKRGSMIDDVDPIELTLQVTSLFEALGAPYIIGGSLAGIFHGVIRNTNDADLVADLRLEHAAPLAEALADTFYVDPKSIREAIQHRTGFNVIHWEPQFKVDVYVPKPRAFDRSQLDRRLQVIIAADPERTASIATPEDTILAKLEWYEMGGRVSERQWRDALGIMKIQADRLDLGYFRK